MWSRPVNGRRTSTRPTVQQAAVAAVVQTSGQRPCTVYKRLPADADQSADGKKYNSLL